MKWKKYTLHTVSAAEELVTSLLYDLDITNIEVVDSLPVMDEAEEKLFEDVMPALKEDDGKADVIFYLDDDVPSEELLNALQEGLDELRDFMDIGEGSIEEQDTEDKDWVNNWKEHFTAFSVDEFLIKPTWIELKEEEKGKTLIEIDPGTAFGTGSHETTKLCIHGISRFLKPHDRVLDVGTGSGILSIIALKKGAAYALGTDIDELAVSQAEENFAVNGVDPSRYQLILGDILTDDSVQAAVGDEAYDLVLANILADVIIPLQKEVTRHMKHGAVLVVSGIINLKEEAVRQALEENPELEILKTSYEGEWVSFAARRV